MPFAEKVDFVGYDDLEGRSGFKLAMQEVDGSFFLYVAALTLITKLIGLPLDYYRTYADRVGKVSRAEVKRVVTKWVTPARWPVVIVGPVAQSKEALEKLNLGPVSIAPAVPGAKPSASTP